MDGVDQMELLQLQYFRQVARLEHMTEAARQLHVTQSSLSKTIQRLEEDLGVPLFHRTGRKLHLNEFGHIYLQRVERALFELDQGAQALHDLSGPEYGTVELAVTTSGTLPHLLRRFREKRPHVQFHVQMTTTHELEPLLQRGEVDFCLSFPPIHGEEIACQTVLRDPIVLAVPKAHRLAGRSSVSLADLKDEWFVGLRRGYGGRDLTDGICETVGFLPKHVYEGDEPARLNAFVEAGIGIAFIPATSKPASSNGDVVYLRVEHPGLVREVALSWHRSRYMSRAASEFREVVLDYFKKISV